MFLKNMKFLGVVIYIIFGTLQFSNALRGRQVSSSFVVNRPKGDELPEICSTFKDEGSELPQDGPSPYEIIVDRIAPSVYEVIIQGKQRQLFTDFVLAVISPFQGEFSKESYETFECDVTHPDRETMIRTSVSDRFIPKRQAVAHFYPRKANGKVILRGSVYANKTTFWSVENSMLQFPILI